MAAQSDDELTFIPGRKLCPDGSCVGIIGKDAKCTICGTSSAAGDSPAEQAPTTSDAGGESDVESEAEPDFQAIERGPEDSSSGFDPNRRLCGDDTCIGVIGGDNRCRICGKPAVS
jgi:hypothetical protein